MSMISAITSRGHLRFMIIEDGGVNADAFIEFIKRLLVGAKRKIFLIIDGGSAHRAKKTKSLSKACTENSHPTNHRDVGPKGFDDPTAAPSFAEITDIGLQQDACLGQPLRRVFSFPDQRLKVVALFRAQPHHILFYRYVLEMHDHRAPLIGDASESANG
jgi:DDE superfamily endonuclease